MLVPTAGAQDWGAEFADALTNGEFDLNFRYRYEYVDQDSFDKDANASTLRTRLVYKSADFKNFFLTLNMDDLRPVVADNFNDTRNGKTQYPTVADPKGTDLNLASITFTGLEDGTIVFGRQRIIRNNARFIGNVVWRQNEQTYDSVSIDYAITDKFQAYYAYLDSVKRIFGPDSVPEGQTGPAETFHSKSHVIDASYTFTPLFKLFGYAYLLDFKNGENFSNQTLGLRLSGAQTFGDDLNFSYAAEYAKQEDYGDNPNSYDEGYYVVEAGLDWSRFGGKIGYEVLEGSGNAGESFQTPLATLYKFNGLADQFLTTPPGGLEDLYIQGTLKALGGTFSLVYHDFSVETGGGDYGSEIDFISKWSFWDHYSALLGFGAFDADRSDPQGRSDVTKVWLMLSASF